MIYPQLASGGKQKERHAHKASNHHKRKVQKGESYKDRHSEKLTNILQKKRMKMKLKSS